MCFRLTIKIHFFYIPRTVSNCTHQQEQLSQVKTIGFNFLQLLKNTLFLFNFFNLLFLYSNIYTVPSIRQHSSQIPNRFYFFRLSIIRRIYSFTANIQFLAIRRNWYFDFPETPSPYTIVALTRSFEIRSMPSLPTIYRYIDSYNSTATSRPSKSFNGNFWDLWENGAVGGSANCRLNWEFLDCRSRVPVNIMPIYVWRKSLEKGEKMAGKIFLLYNPFVANDLNFLLCWRGFYATISHYELQLIY